MESGRGGLSYVTDAKQQNPLQLFQLPSKRCLHPLLLPSLQASVSHRSVSVPGCTCASSLASHGNSVNEAPLQAPCVCCHGNSRSLPGGRSRQLALSAVRRRFRSPPATRRLFTSLVYSPAAARVGSHFQGQSSWAAGADVSETPLQYSHRCDIERGRMQLLPQPVGLIVYIF